MNAEEARQKTLDTLNGFENQATEWDSIMKCIENATKEFNWFRTIWRSSRRMNLGNWIRLFELGYFVNPIWNTDGFIEYWINFDKDYKLKSKDEIIANYYLQPEHEIKNTY